MIRLALILALLGVLAPAAPAGGKKPPQMQLSFHLEGSELEGPNRVFPQLTAGKTVYYRHTPELTLNDVSAFRPFPSEDPSGYGVVLELKSRSARRLHSIASTNNGKYLLAVVNGQVRDAVLIDQPAADPYIIIWQRITPAEIRIADTVMPRIGEDPKVWKERMKKK